MKTDEHTDERMEALVEQELRTKPKRKGAVFYGPEEIRSSQKI